MPNSRSFGNWGSLEKHELIGRFQYDGFTYAWPAVCGFDSISKQFKFCCEGPVEGGEVITTKQVCLPTTSSWSEHWFTSLLCDEIFLCYKIVSFQDVEAIDNTHAKLDSTEDYVKECETW